MNSRTLFELIGTADEELLERSERAAPAKRRGPRLRRALVLAAAAAAVLAATVTAAAVAGEPDLLRWIADAFSRNNTDAHHVPNQDVIQAQIAEGEWIYLNGENVAVILPDSPVQIMLSGDGGATWKQSTVQGSGEMEIWGEPCDGVQYYGGYIGFFGEGGGYLVLTAGVRMNNQPMRIYLTDDGGDTWTEIGNPYGSHASVLTGAGFSTPEIGFISYRYYEDAGPDIWWTRDGGDTWEKLQVTLPPEYSAETYRFTPQSPGVDGAEGVYPIAIPGRDAGEETMIYMHSSDYGLTWAFQ